MLYFLEALRKQRSVIDGERGKEKHYLNKQILKDVFFPNLKKNSKAFSAYLYEGNKISISTLSYPR